MTTTQHVHVMVDLETLATTIDAHVLTLGACVFDPLTGKLGESFYARLSPDGQRRRIDYSTVLWWMEQSPEARAEVFAPDGRHLPSRVYADFTDWICAVGASRLWAQDPDFDIAIVKDLARDLDMKWPVRYDAGRSVRTVRALAWPDGVPASVRAACYGIGGAVAHNALEDAKAQARLVSAAVQSLRPGGGFSIDAHETWGRSVAVFGIPAKILEPLQPGEMRVDEYVDIEAALGLGAGAPSPQPAVTPRIAQDGSRSVEDDALPRSTDTVGSDPTAG